MSLPYAEPLVPREPGARQIPEPPRRGEPGGPPCAICGGETTTRALVGRATGRCTRRSAAACRARSGSRAASTSTRSPTCPSEVAATFGRVVARAERAILALGDVGRVHLYRWGDGGAHFHVWLHAAAARDGRGAGMMLPLWEDVLPNVADERARRGGAARRRPRCDRDAPLARRLGTRDAVVIGLGSMIGAGVFAAFGAGRRRRRAAGCCSGSRSPPASRTATRSRPPSSPRSTRPPAAPTSTAASGSASGGASSPAGGSSSARPASCAAMALTFASYAVRGSLLAAARSSRCVAVLALTAVNYRGITRTAAPRAGARRASRSRRCSSSCVAIALSGRASRRAPRGLPLGDGGVHGIFQAAALLFFAFAGYARIATLGEEVGSRSGRSRARSRSRSASTVVLYAVVARRGAARGGARRRSRPRSRRSRRPSTRSARRGRRRSCASAPRSRASASLLALVAGLGRTSARDGAQRRPAALARGGRIRGTRCPHHAELAVGAAVVGARADDRPARRDRLLVVRRAPLLRRRERVGVDAGRGAPPLAALR